MLSKYYSKYFYNYMQTEVLLIKQPENTSKKQLHQVPCMHTHKQSLLASGEWAVTPTQ